MIYEVIRQGSFKLLTRLYARFIWLNTVQIASKSDVRLSRYCKFSSWVFFYPPGSLREAKTWYRLVLNMLSNRPTRVSLARSQALPFKDKHMTGTILVYYHVTCSRLYSMNFEWSNNQPVIKDWAAVDIANWRNDIRIRCPENIHYPTLFMFPVSAHANVAQSRRWTRRPQQARINRGHLPRAPFLQGAPATEIRTIIAFFNNANVIRVFLIWLLSAS